LLKLDAGKTDAELKKLASKYAAQPNALFDKLEEKYGARP
jgi:hypothetical protein